MLLSLMSCVRKYPSALDSLLKAEIMGGDVEVVTLFPGEADAYLNLVKECY